MNPSPDDDMMAKADDAARLLRAMAHGPRLRILCLLVGNELCSGDIAAALAMRGAAASQQLALLRAERLIEARREGKNVHYTLANPLVSQLVSALRGYFCEHAVEPPETKAKGQEKRAENAALKRAIPVRARGRWCS